MKTVYVNKDFDIKIAIMKATLDNAYSKFIVITWGDNTYMYTSLYRANEKLMHILGHDMKCGDWDIMQAKLTFAWNK